MNEKPKTPEAGQSAILAVDAGSASGAIATQASAVDIGHSALAGDRWPREETAINNPVSDALDLVDVGAQRSADPQRWMAVAAPMCAQCEGVEDVGEAAGRILAAEVRRLNEALDREQRRIKELEDHAQAVRCSRDFWADKCNAVGAWLVEWQRVLREVGPTLKTDAEEYIPAHVIEELAGIISPPPKAGLVRDALHSVPKCKECNGTGKDAPHTDRWCDACAGTGLQPNASGEPHRGAH